MTKSPFTYVSDLFLQGRINKFVVNFESDLGKYLESNIITYGVLDTLELKNDIENNEGLCKSLNCKIF